MLALLYKELDRLRCGRLSPVVPKWTPATALIRYQPGRPDVRGRVTESIRPARPPLRRLWRYMS